MDEEPLDVGRRGGQVTPQCGRVRAGQRLVGVQPEDPLAAAVPERLVAGPGEVVVPVPVDDDRAGGPGDLDRVVDRAGVVDDDLVGDRRERFQAAGEVLVLVAHDQARRHERRARRRRRRPATALSGRVSPAVVQVRALGDDEPAVAAGPLGQRGNGIGPGERPGHPAGTVDERSPDGQRRPGQPGRRAHHPRPAGDEPAGERPVDVRLVRAVRDADEQLVPVGQVRPGGGGGDVRVAERVDEPVGPAGRRHGALVDDDDDLVGRRSGRRPAQSSRPTHPPAAGVGGGSAGTDEHHVVRRRQRLAEDIEEGPGRSAIGASQDGDGDRSAWHVGRSPNRSGHPAVRVPPDGPIGRNGPRLKPRARPPNGAQVGRAGDR